MSTASRRTSRYPTPLPPSPMILHFPRSRRTRRKHPKPITHHHHINNPLLAHQQYLSQKGKLDNLFDQENERPVILFDPNSKISVFERRERVEEDEEKELGEYSHGSGVFEEEKWRFQAEILRAECNFLRMEREFALKKLERNRVKMERTLRSAVQTLVSGRKKIFEGKSVNAVLEEEIEDLAEKLEELQKSSRVKDSDVRKCSNFDKKACVLQRRLEKLGGLSDQSSLKELQELPESNLSIDIRHIDKQSLISNTQIENKSTDMDLLKNKMEGISKGMLDRVEGEYGSMLSVTSNSSVASPASTSKRIDQFSEFSTRQLHQDQMLNEDHKCSGRCKAIVRRIVEQVRAETEQWSQMQEMLGQVRGEMEELQTSRDYWENRAHNLDYDIQSLRHTAEEWKENALRNESKANELQLEISILKEELRMSKEKSNQIPLRVPLGKQLQKEKLLLSRHFKENHHVDKSSCINNAVEELNVQGSKETKGTKDSPPITLGKQLAKEKRMLLRRLKENRRSNEISSKQEVVSRRIKLCANDKGMESMTSSPLREIGNVSPLARENSRAAFSFHSPESSRIRESFRK